MTTYHPGSLHTLVAIADEYAMTVGEIALFRSLLHGKAAHVDDAGTAYYRWCDIDRALERMDRRTEALLRAA